MEPGKAAILAGVDNDKVTSVKALMETVGGTMQRLALPNDFLPRPTKNKIGSSNEFCVREPLKPA